MGNQLLTIIEYIALDNAERSSSPAILILAHNRRFIRERGKVLGETLCDCLPIRLPG